MPISAQLRQYVVAARSMPPTVPTAGVVLTSASKPGTAFGLVAPSRCTSMSQFSWKPSFRVVQFSWRMLTIWIFSASVITALRSSVRMMPLLASSVSLRVKPSKASYAWNGARRTVFLRL
ncbi:hypothetical protein D3C72_1529330 [compost metagenome]